MRAFGILAVAAAAAVYAGDPPPASADSIAAAKKEFAAIKAMPGDSGLLPGDAEFKPEVAAPSATVAPAPEREWGHANPAPGATGNWLVDAMERKPAGSAPSPGGDDWFRGELDLLKANSAEGTGKGMAAQGEPVGTGARLASGSVVNPLDAFMGGWISARDKELLLPDRRMQPFLGGIDAGPPGPAADGAFLRSDSPDGSAAPSNPYIAGLNPAVPPLAAPEVPTYNPSVIPDLSGGNLPSSPATKQFEAPRLELPDFSQPTDDDKYFRQMRRF